MQIKKVLNASCWVFFLFLLVLLPGCQPRRKRYKITGTPKIISAKKQEYTLRVQGVECKQCALSALKALSLVPRIKNVECVCPKKQYAQACFECTFIKSGKPLPFDEIQERLEEENFALTDVYGFFTGTVKHVADQWKMELKGDNRVVMLRTSQLILQHMAQRMGKKNMPIQMTIVGSFNPADNTLSVDYLPV